MALDAWPLPSGVLLPSIPQSPLTGLLIHSGDAQDPHLLTVHVYLARRFQSGACGEIEGQSTRANHLASIAIFIIFGLRSESC
jgi:hypothetical protein